MRFAPSPNGALHLGHAYSALLNEKLARELDGILLLRIEDIDTARCTPEKRQAVFDDLAWLGLSFDPPTTRLQSAHFDFYGVALEKLRKMELVYPAFMTRGEIRSHVARFEARGKSWPRDPDGSPHYPGIEREMDDATRKQRIAEGQPFAWRLDVRRALARLEKPLTWQEATDETATTWRLETADPARWGDIIIARSDTPVSYHLVVVLDDAVQSITHVVRGRDLFEATAVHRLLQTLLDLPEPVYLHHRLILDETGHKLAKSRGSMSLADYRAHGVTSTELRVRLGFASL
ncbi:tRNA glutamyl-Q(34) synthetase GluQRS [Limoniibacter endophyticus]|uniref:tRNA glutamyl-Q(34) synthetase GluQRS n=1 Tax=Limoniibacter endophyticus TaxID=1565040 RepID=A0A8J3DIX3_9HYPH|nr:tRNA glutamyl-Q(34) synthetase GluQRS [Limoniibacter endophyticus]